MIRIQLRLAGAGMRTSDSFPRVPRIPVKGDVLRVHVDEVESCFVVDEVSFYYHGSRNQLAGQQPRIDQDTEPYSIFVLAKRQH